MKHALIGLLLLVPRVASADTLYGYIGGTFTMTQGVYQSGISQITGSFLLDEAFVASLDPDRGVGPTDVTSGVLAYSFSDGYQILTQDNSNASFRVGFTFDTPAQPYVPGSGNILPYFWSFGITNETGGMVALYMNREWSSSAWIGTTPPNIAHCETNPLGTHCFTDPSLNAMLMNNTFGGQFLAGGGQGAWTVQSVPEPSTLLLVALGAAGLARRHLNSRGNRSRGQTP